MFTHAETNDNGPTGASSICDPSKVTLYLFQKQPGAFGLMRYDGQWGLTLQCPMPRERGEVLRPHKPGLKSEIANAPRTFGIPGLPAPKLAKKLPSFLKVV